MGILQRIKNIISTKAFIFSTIAIALTGMILTTSMVVYGSKAYGKDNQGSNYLEQWELSAAHYGDDWYDNYWVLNLTEITKGMQISWNQLSKSKIEYTTNIGFSGKLGIINSYGLVYLDEFGENGTEPFTATITYDKKYSVNINFNDPKTFAGNTLNAVHFMEQGSSGNYWKFDINGEEIDNYNQLQFEITNKGTYFEGELSANMKKLSFIKSENSPYGLGYFEAKIKYTVGQNNYTCTIKNGNVPENGLYVAYWHAEKTDYFKLALMKDGKLDKNHEEIYREYLGNNSIITFLLPNEIINSKNFSLNVYSSFITFNYEYVYKFGGIKYEPESFSSIHFDFLPYNLIIQYGEDEAAAEISAPNFAS
ncbi:MAG: hypothetical protein LBH47_03745 [Christensenellaceae bacterium]|jgi:hypothetical protein|nr:hypothetical protein [Christensenellaceae bacterium]